MKLRAVIFSLAIAFTAHAEPPPGTVTRKEVIAMAERYLLLTWAPTEKNVLHGKDANGVRVDTPDTTWKPATGNPGWWEPGVKATGMPYKWGGFDTPEKFLAGVRAGRPAGDTYTAEKRRLLEAGTSKAAAGIDCSGFVSRCWNLPHAFSTRTITRFCDPLKDLGDLRPGDIFNTNNAHVLLFAGWAKPDRSRLLAYETGAPPMMKVLLNDMGTEWLLAKGYKPWRYRGMRD